MVSLMRWGIAGCGLIGQKRAAALRALGHDVMVVSDVVHERALALAGTFGADVAEDWQALAASPKVDAVVVATSHEWLSPVAVRCLDHAKHVLVEKPAGRNLAEVKAVAAAGLRSSRMVKVGYNHRFHPAIRKARDIVDSGALGNLMFVRGRYGHGGRLGYEKEWRLSRAQSGGGELLDQGSHLVDLARWFLGEFSGVQAMLRTFFWSADVEDNCFLTLSTPAGQVAWLHATWTEWKNMFSFEIYGRHGKLAIDGLGGSYGVETLTYYRMLPQMGPPETMRWDWPEPDNSWDLELQEFAAAITERRCPIGDINDALGTMTVIERIYREKPQ
ncbi:MAG: Gfo/Idh/MocA family protein [Steroidobacteraceae bacterium]